MTLVTFGFGSAQLVHSLRAGRLNSVAPICRVVTSSPVVALSFDDGPDAEYTPRALALLSRLRIKATFFVTGRKAARLEQIVRRQVQEGMEVGNHTWSHPHLERMTPQAARDEIERGVDELRRRGIDVRLFRAPYGPITFEQLTIARDSGLITVHWSAPVDRYVGSMGLEPREAASALADVIRPGDIILAHDSPGRLRPKAFAALELLLLNLVQRDFRITTVSELLDSGRAVTAQARPWFWQSGFRCRRAGEISRSHGR